MLRVGITGTGKIAKTHARALARLPDAKLTAVVNHRPESMAEFAAAFDVAEQYPAVEALLAAKSVDALVVATPNVFHAAETIQALDAGLPVLVEKPMAVSASEAGEMVAASERAAVPLMVAQNWRFDQEVCWLREQVAAGRLGEIVRTRGYGAKANRGPAGWYETRQYAGGGALLDMGIHALDTARFLLGNPLPMTVFAVSGAYYRQIDVEDTAVMMVRWMNAGCTYIEAGNWQPWSDGPDAATELYGTLGFGQVFPTRLAFPAAEMSQLEIIEGPFAPREKHIQQQMYDDQMAHFVSCVRSGAWPESSGVQGWINMRILEAAYQSAKSGDSVRIEWSEGDGSQAG